MPKQLPNYKELDLDLESLRPFSEISLIAVDLDGTLLQASDSDLPNKVLTLAKRLIHPRFSVRLTIATGRTLHGSRPFFEKLPIQNDIPIILYNGSVVLANGYDVILQKTISASTLHRIVRSFSNFRTKIIAYVFNRFGSDYPSETAYGWSSEERASHEHNGMLVKWMDWDYSDNAIAPSAIVIHTKGLPPEPIAYICSKLNDMRDICYTRSGDLYIEVKPADCNKGSALAYVADDLKIERKSVLALGDNDNDAEMLSWAGIGVAIKPGSQRAIANSDFIANHGVIDGAIEVLELVRNARRLFRPALNRFAPGSRKFSVFAEIADDLSKRNARDISIPEQFIAKWEAPQYLTERYGRHVTVSEFDSIVSSGLLPTFRFAEQNVFLKNDLDSLSALLSKSNITSANLLGEEVIDRDALNIFPSTRINIQHNSSVLSPTFYSAARNLIAAHESRADFSDEPEALMAYISGSSLTTSSSKIRDLASVQVRRERQVDISIVSQFAQSAHYMGSKRALCGFIVEGISSVLPESGIVLDLMCGSGVASGAFNRLWRTVASDAQEFCRILATIHGGGFEPKRANLLIQELMPAFKKHFEVMTLRLNDALEREDSLFCRNTDDKLLQEYNRFVLEFPILSKGGEYSNWNPQLEVSIRRNAPSLYPYCLFTSYFSNVYFGLRQCVEIDSLRYAIDQLDDLSSRVWALGALIATISALGTTYGGHFAQPMVKDYSNLSLEGLAQIMNKRTPSIAHEFTVRLLNLSEQSEKCPRQIVVVPGPWPKALEQFEQVLERQQALVYLDAPYTRDEYSRYYHVLETLINYSYPSCIGIGLAPKPGDRFKSEFFTRSKEKMVNAFSRVIESILKKGWMCAWSYSDLKSGHSVDIIASVCSRTACTVKSYRAPYVHKSQGGVKPKAVAESLLIFSPKM